MALLMDYTNIGRTRIDEIWSDNLVFEVTHVAYGTSGYNVVLPATPMPLNGAALSLVAEGFRKPIAAMTQDVLAIPRGKETVFTTVGGAEYTGILGEAGIIATVIAPGTTGLSIGDEFLLAHAHFGRIVLSLYGRLPIKWPLDLQGNILSYTGASIILGTASSLVPTTGAGIYGAFALTAGMLPDGMVLNAGTGEIAGTPTITALLGGSPVGTYSGIEITADGTVVSKSISIAVLGVTLPMPTRFWSMDNNAVDVNILVEDSGGLNNSIFNTGVPGAVGAEAEAFAYAGAEYTDIAASPGVAVGSGDFVFSVYPRQLSTAAANRYMAGKGSSSAGGSRYALGVDASNRPYFVVDDNTVAALSAGTIGQIDDAAFHTVTGQRTGTNIELYVDGVIEATTAIGAYGSLDSARGLTFGGLWDEVGGMFQSFWDGEIDAVSLWAGQSMNSNELATIEWLRSSPGRTLGNWIGGTVPLAPTYAAQSLSDGVAASFIPTHPASDDVSLSYFRFTRLPNGLTVNPATGEVSGTPVLSIGTGAAASMAAAAAGQIVVTGLTGMTTDSIGRTLAFMGVGAALNGGSFEILSYVSSSSVVISDNGAAPGADANNGALFWEERDPASQTTRIAVTDGINLAVSAPFIINVI